MIVPSVLDIIIRVAQESLYNLVQIGCRRSDLVGVFPSGNKTIVVISIELVVK